MQDRLALGGPNAQASHAHRKRSVLRCISASRPHHAVARTESSVVLQFLSCLTLSTREGRGLTIHSLTLSGVQSYSST